jgi:hypothetical protein
MSETSIAICTDDTGRPRQIPEHKWPKKDRAYTVDWVGVSDRNTVIVHLKELQLGDESYPYTGFAHTRFRFSKKGDRQQADESVKNLIQELGL